jgi:hypothetical protein
MAKTNGLKALFFDIFGTCVDWRKTVTEALIDAAKQAGDTKMVLHDDTVAVDNIADHNITVSRRLGRLRPRMAHIILNIHARSGCRPIVDLEDCRRTPPRLPT